MTTTTNDTDRAREMIDTLDHLFRQMEEAEGPALVRASDAYYAHRDECLSFADTSSEAAAAIIESVLPL